METQTPDGRPLSISRDPDGWSVSVQSSPNSTLSLRGPELASLLAKVSGASDDDWTAALAAEAERKTWQPLGWRRR
jgi:hypothetical protein